MQNIDERDLVVMSRDGDPRAYGELVDRYKQAIYHHCFAMMRDEDSAEDVAQEAFIAAYYSLHTYDTSRRFSTWLFKIATNKALNHLKKRSRESTIDDAKLHMVVSPHKEPHTASEDEEIHTAVDRLRPEYQAVISLYYWQGVSYRDIAFIMKKPEGTIKVWMKRAKECLRKELS